MNKKFLGIKVSTYLTALLSVVCAVAVWLVVKGSGYLPSDAAAFNFLSFKI